MSESQNEKEALLDKPTITIRPAVHHDAPALRNLARQIIDQSLASTLDEVPPLQALEQDIMAVSSTDLIYLVADAHIQARSTAQSPLPVWKSAMAKIVYHLSDEIKTALSQDLLGSVIVLPYRGLLGGKRSCYNGTAIIIVSTLGESVLGARLYHAIGAALVDSALSLCRRAGFPYRTLVASMTYREDQSELAGRVDMMLEKGFERSGTMRNTIQKKGLLLDEVFLQKMLEPVEGATSEKAVGS